MIYVLLTPVVVILAFLIVGHSLSAPGYNGPPSDHFTGKKFINPGNPEAHGLGALLKWLTNRQRGPWKYHHEEADVKPQETVTQTRITFINHTTFLIQTQGVNILTDPVYSERVSPFSFAGPKRMRPPGVKFEDLPKIDLVLLSHNHYDHLDVATVTRLKQSFDPVFVVPLGVAKYLQQKDITRIEELDWWKNVSTVSLNITSIPAQHFSGRGFFDRDKTLWCGYTIGTKDTTICFLGDTGYNEQIFTTIPKRIGDIDLAIVPIGAYKPLWFMSPVHCSPEEAVQIHLDLKARMSIASHFGTFPLGDDGEEDPVLDLARAREKFNIASEEFIPLKQGASLDYKA